MKNKELIGTTFALITAIISGIAIPVNKVFVHNLDPTIFTALRALIIGLVFMIIILVQKKPKTEKLTKVSWPYLISIGIIGGGAAFLLFFTGLGLTTSGRGAFFHKTLPIYIAIFAFLFLKEKITHKQLSHLFIMLAGVFLIFYAQIGPAKMWSNPQLGDLMIIGATILWAIENTIARKAMIKGETNFVVTFARMFIGAIFLWGVLLLFGNIEQLAGLGTIQIRNILISTAILFGYVFSWYWAIKLINLTKAASILLLAPVISLLVGYFWLGEPVPSIQILGSLLILVGAFYFVRIKSEFATGV